MTNEQIKILETAGIIPKDTPASQVKVFAQVCSEKGLSPFSKEIYLTRYWSKKEQRHIYSVITGINGYRKLASNSGEFAGKDDEKYNLESNGSFLTAYDLKAEGLLPITCTTTVYRIVQGVRVPFTKTVMFSEFNTGIQKWKTMPFQMISKVSEAFAIRAGFSGEVSGIDIEEEAGAILDEQAVEIPEWKQDLIFEIEAAKDLSELEECWNNHRESIINDSDLLDEVKKKKIKIIEFQKQIEHG